MCRMWEVRSTLQRNSKCTPRITRTDSESSRSPTSPEWPIPEFALQNSSQGHLSRRPTAAFEEGGLNGPRNKSHPGRLRMLDLASDFRMGDLADHGSTNVSKAIDRCRFKHHKGTFGKKLGHCKKHPKVRLICGPFRHVCRQCSPGDFRTCSLCGSLIVNCCC